MRLCERERGGEVEGGFDHCEGRAELVRLLKVNLDQRVKGEESNRALPGYCIARRASRAPASAARVPTKSGWGTPCCAVAGGAGSSHVRRLSYVEDEAVFVSRKHCRQPHRRQGASGEHHS